MMFGMRNRKWEKLRNSLLTVGGARGSNILVTTRRKEVIDVMRCYDPYRVQKLSERKIVGHCLSKKHFLMEEF